MQHNTEVGLFTRPSIIIMEIKVDCYSGYRGEETPKNISMGTRKIEVRKILDRWLAPDHRYFKVLGDDNAIYIIRHDQEKWQWELIFFSETENYANFKAKNNGALSEQ